MMILPPNLEYLAKKVQKKILKALHTPFLGSPKVMEIHHKIKTSVVLHNYNIMQNLSKKLQFQS
jgi:hypothetical protein